MAHKISFSLNVQVSDGPEISVSRSLSVEAFESLEIVVPGGDSGSPGTAEVKVQPGEAEDVQLLLVTSSLYDENLAYTVDGGASGVVLDAPQLFEGAGAMEFLGASPQQFSFSNEAGAGKDATIQILVGRKAVA